MFLSIETAFQYNWNYLYSNIAYIKHLQYSLKGSTAFSRLLKELMEQQKKNIKNHCIRISILVLAFLTLFSIILALQQFPGKQLHLLALSRIFMKLISRRVPISVYVDKKDELLHHPFVLFSLLSPLSLSLPFKWIPYLSTGFSGGTMVKNPPAKQEMQVWSLGRKDTLEKETATQFPVFWPGKSYGWRSLASYSPRGHKRVEDNVATEHACTLWHLSGDEGENFKQAGRFRRAYI